MGYDIEMMDYNAETIQYAFMSIRIAAEKIGFKLNRYKAKHLSMRDLR